jgi:hypothetical protein
VFLENRKSYSRPDPSRLEQTCYKPSVLLQIAVGNGSQGTVAYSALYAYPYFEYVPQGAKSVP